MTLLLFTDAADFEGNLYVAGQVIAFDDATDTSSLPVEPVESAPVFMDHVPR